jgi:glycosyltransferase involved in cell wall biosynthesis
LVALEALTCGTPVIASNQGGLPEIAEPINPQLVFSEDSTILLADILKSFDKANYDRNEIRQLARERCSAERFTNSYLGLVLSQSE